MTEFAKNPFQGNAHGLTMFEVTHVYQLTPPPPELHTINEYIVPRRRIMISTSTVTSCTT